MWYKKNIMLLMLLSFLLLFSFSVCADSVENIETNLQMSIADIIMIIVSGGIVIITAFDARIALMCAFLIYASLFILFTLMTEEGMTGFSPYYSGVAMMVCFVIICLSLLVTYKKSNTPYGVA